MHFPWYVASRISKKTTSGYSGMIIKLAVASIALSIAVMILTSVVISGFKKEISDKIFGFWGNIHITDTRITRNFRIRPIVNDSLLKADIHSIGGLTFQEHKGQPTQKTKGGVKNVSPFITYPGILTNKEREMEGIVLKGVDQEYDVDLFSTYIKEGAFPDLQGAKPSRDLLISQQTASRLRVQLGDRLNVNFIKEESAIKRQFRVTGIYRTGLEEYDRKFAFMDLRNLQSVLGWDADQVGGLEVYIENMEDAPHIADYIYDELLSPGLFAETIQEKQPNIFEWLELQDINEKIILLLMVIVALINMATALLILILEKSKMIGILKSLGQNDGGIRRIFLYEAMYILSLALLIGNAVGLGIAALQKKIGFLKLDEENYYLSEVPINFNFSGLLLINLGAIIITFLCMMLPTYVVTKISPIDILRFD